MARDLVRWPLPTYPPPKPKDRLMPMSHEEKMREALAAGDRQGAHDAWVAASQALGHPPLDDAGDPLPDPLEQ